MLLIWEGSYSLGYFTSWETQLNLAKVPTTIYTQRYPGYCPPLLFGNVILPLQDSVRYLWFTQNRQLHFDEHITNLQNKMREVMNALLQLRCNLQGGYKSENLSAQMCTSTGEQAKNKTTSNVGVKGLLQNVVPALWTDKKKFEGKEFTCFLKMSGDSGPYLVQALYTFKGKNNDELCFKKGDIITVTQREEGGWWEGTLGEKTGWFPSNYVKEYKLQDGRNSLDSGKTSPSKLPPEVVAQQKAYRNLVLKDLIESEKAHVAELQGLLKNFLHPLEKSDIQRPALEQRVGKVFLSAAPRIKQVHQAYCASHPRAVCVLDKFKDELNTFMEAQGAASPGLLVLTTGLSKPFRRLEKYAGMLQELERHVEENHPDRGDTQRSVSVYKDIASACSSMRRQKELELEVLTGGVRGWEGEDLSCLGEILHMGSVAVGPDHMDRYLVLFPTTLLMLSVSQRMSAFIYEPFVTSYPLYSAPIRTPLSIGSLGGHYRSRFHAPMGSSLFLPLDKARQQWSVFYTVVPRSEAVSQPWPVGEWLPNLYERTY
uniref:Rho guanine nucleotide exchange factor 7 n=1 Tax=Timema bartmani TaxID=61472 RepID=A0A7R9EYR5_9NEOP|nr:unnamed protein product [Timema bartmani]